MNPTDDTRRPRRGAREAVEFLVSSWNRFDVLDAVADGPRTRTELKERTDVSRVTLSRILSDLEDRGWIDREADRFEATASGAVVAAELSRLLDNVKAADDLGGVVEWLPVDQFDFDLRHLADATVITPGHGDLTAPTQDLVDLAHGCRRIRAIPTGITHEFIAALRDATVDGDLSLECLLPPAVFEVVSDDAELRRQFSNMSDSGQTRIFHYRGDASVPMLGIFDDRVMICGHGEGDVPPGTIETTDDFVRSWAESYFEARRAEGRQLEPGAFTP